MNIFRNIFSKTYKPSLHTQLGRWNIVYEPKIIKCKVDQANEDHCGCCSNYNEIDTEMKQNKSNNILTHGNIEDDSYYDPYIYY